MHVYVRTYIRTYMHTYITSIIFFSEKQDQKRLHSYLSNALNVKLDTRGEISLIRERHYVLTRDFAFKMLNIHERKECGMPVIIEGETGVGKTFLLELLSSLWNDSWIRHFKRQKEIIMVSERV